MNEIKDIECLRANQVARALSVKPTTVYKWIQRGKLACYREGRCILIQLKDVKEFLEKRRIESKS